MELDRFSNVCKNRETLIEKEIKKGNRDIVIYDNLFIEKESKFVVLNLQDWLLLDNSFIKRYGKYKNVHSITIKENIIEEN